MPTKITIQNISKGYQSIINNGRHSIVGDEPFKSNGTDLGFSPTELLLSALAMCKVATVRFVARKKGWNIGDVHAELSQEVKRDKTGRLSTSVQVAISIEGELTPEQKTTLFNEANKCYVHRMIEGEWNIAPAVEWEQGATV